MPPAIRNSLIALCLIFLLGGGYYRVQSQRSGERLDRSKEGWAIFIGIRLTGGLALLTVGAWLSHPFSFEWATIPVPIMVRWLGVVWFGSAIAWLLWMFHSLGRNLTDTVVTRSDAYFVDQGPYRYIRNPMYTGVFMLGASLGFALGTWLVPLLTTITFLFFVTRTRTEEQYLLDRFGDQYRNYMNRVGRFLPHL